MYINFNNLSRSDLIRSIFRFSCTVKYLKVLWFVYNQKVATVRLKIPLDVGGIEDIQEERHHHQWMGGCQGMSHKWFTTFCNKRWISDEILNKFRRVGRNFLVFLKNVSWKPTKKIRYKRYSLFIFKCQFFDLNPVAHLFEFTWRSNQNYFKERSQLPMSWHKSIRVEIILWKVRRRIVLILVSCGSILDAHVWIADRWI